MGVVNFFYSLGILLLTLGIVLLSILALKKSFTHATSKKWFQRIGLQAQNLQLCESLMLDSKRRIVVVRHGEEGYVVLLGQTHETLLKGPFVFENAFEKALGREG